MIIKDQSATLEFLTSAATHGLQPGEITVIHTHISVIILAGSVAYKLKRAVCLPYVDFSTPERRIQACLRELYLNRRTAPSLYLGVRRITQDSSGRIAFDGPGQIIDAVVEMRRFNDDALLENVAQQGRLTASLVTRLASAVAKFHQAAPTIWDARPKAELARVLATNQQAFSAAPLLPAAGVAKLSAALHLELEKNGKVLEARASSGKVRRCHGDLHLRNICVIDGEPTLFDCMEFDDSLATIDVLYDLAFLVMDLWFRGLEAHANLVLNRYLDMQNDENGLIVMPFFMALRAAIRSHVLVTQAVESENERRAFLLKNAQRYLDMAFTYLTPRPARLIAIGGLSGSGKSVLATAIAHLFGPVPGARILSSDRIRKSLYGRSIELPLPAQAYRPDVSEHVYAEQARRAADTIGSGYAVIADAVFDRAADRARIEQCAVRAGVSFTGLWLEAPAATLLARVNARTNDPSDAKEAVVRTQLMRQQEVAGWVHINAGGTPEATAVLVLHALGVHSSAYS